MISICRWLLLVTKIEERRNGDGRVGTMVEKGWGKLGLMKEKWGIWRVVVVVVR